MRLEREARDFAVDLQGAPHHRAPNVAHRNVPRLPLDLHTAKPQTANLRPLDLGWQGGDRVRSVLCTDRELRGKALRCGSKDDLRLTTLKAMLLSWPTNALSQLDKEESSLHENAWQHFLRSQDEESRVLREANQFDADGNFWVDLPSDPSEFEEVENEDSQDVFQVADEENKDEEKLATEQEAKKEDEESVKMKVLCPRPSTLSPFVRSTGIGFLSAGRFCRTRES